MPYYMVLNDGETYTGLDGCKIVRVTDEAIIEDADFDTVIEDIATTGENFHGKVVAEFDGTSMIAGSCGTTVGFL